MKRKIGILLLTVTAAAAMAAGLAACSSSDGASAYDLAVENGYTGTVTEWLESLKGDTGATGATGETGAQGEKGDTGATGATGTAGTNGTNGVGIESVTLDKYNDIVVTYTDGNSETLKYHGTQGNPYVIDDGVFENGYVEDSFTVEADDTVYFTVYLNSGMPYITISGLEDTDLVTLSYDYFNFTYSAESEEVDGVDSCSAEYSISYDDTTKLFAEIAYAGEFTLAVTNTSDAAKTFTLNIIDTTISVEDGGYVVVPTAGNYTAAKYALTYDDGTYSWSAEASSYTTKDEQDNESTVYEYLKNFRLYELDVTAVEDIYNDLGEEPSYKATVTSNSDNIYVDICIVFSDLNNLGSFIESLSYSVDSYLEYCYYYNGAYIYPLTQQFTNDSASDFFYFLVSESCNSDGYLGYYLLVSTDEDGDLAYGTITFAADSYQDINYTFETTGATDISSVTEATELLLDTAYQVTLSSYQDENNDWRPSSIGYSEDGEMMFTFTTTEAGYYTFAIAGDDTAVGNVYIIIADSTYEYYATIGTKGYGWLATSYENYTIYVDADVTLNFTIAQNSSAYDDTGDEETATPQTIYFIIDKDVIE